jgi:predicted TIM-barrel fold metal-dependent hydrolase
MAGSPFSMPIIDSHQHLGRSLFSGVVTTEHELVQAMNLHGVDVALVMPQPTLEDVRGVHDQIAAAVERNRDRLYGIASINPWWSETDYGAEARRCVRDLGFVALKLHPLGHNIATNHPEADKVFRTAAELGVSVIVHTGLGSPWALPSLCIPPARRYPEVRVILAHAGWGLYSAEAIVAAEVCDNLYLEPSWCPGYMARQMIDKLGTGRVLWGSDHLTNLPVELTKYRSLGLSDAELANILGGTARAIFSLTS